MVNYTINNATMYDETEPLVQKSEKIFNPAKTRPPMKYAIIIPAIVFTVLGVQIHLYVVNEWTQYVIRNSEFPNLTAVANFTACSDTESNHTNSEYSQYKTVQQKSAEWITFYNIALHVPALFSCFLFTSLTDAHGRRFLFILASFGLCCRSSLMAAIIYFKLSFSYVVSIYALDGVLGSSYAIYAMAYSYVADLTTRDNQRVLYIVFIQFTIVATTMLSSFLSGSLIEDWNLGYFYTDLISVFIGFIGFFMFAFAVPESLTDKSMITNRPFCTMFKRPLQFYCSQKFKETRLCYVLLLASFAFAEISGLNRSSIETLYFLGQPFCWGPKAIGYFQTTRHAIQGFLGLGSVKLFQKCISNEFIAILSTLSNASSFVLEAYAKDYIIFIVPVVGIFGFLLSPLIRAMMSNITSPEKQGAVFAGIAAVEVLSSIITLIAENAVYAWTLSQMNGFVFLIMAAFCVIDLTLLLCFCYVKPYKSLGTEVLIQESSRVIRTKWEKSKSEWF
ncbi:solute carrier family 46 member 3-like [Mya arenaria]|uniref:solute carrier family 46 member 3-like n=1 Tax=Mya arenaria TaxID=6604 RepID=UPI0022E8CBFE|nr:solute carrier family 46 member 3-like [Mya arenaria]